MSRRPNGVCVLSEVNAKACLDSCTYDMMKTLLVPCVMTYLDAKVMLLVNLIQNGKSGQQFLAF